MIGTSNPATFSKVLTYDTMVKFPKSYQRIQSRVKYTTTKSGDQWVWLS